MSPRSGKSLLPAGKQARALWRWLPALAVCAVTLLAAPWLVGPPCPKHVVIATGRPDGAYYAFAQQYAELLREQGLRLEIRTTAGSVENTELLRDADTGVSLAFVQGGISTAEDEQQLESLASLYLEPIWVFYRGQQPLDRLSQLRGKRIAVGAPGSGTRSVALKLLAENEVAAVGDPATSLISLGGTKAAAALKDGQVDVAFFVISPRAALVQELLETRGIQLMSFRRAAAYCAKFPYLSSVTLSEGLVDLQKNIPPRDIMLLAPAANLVARHDLHPALVSVLLETAIRVHERGGFLEQPGAFPTPHLVDFSLNENARRYFKSGPPMFYRVFPFRLAAWFDQVKLVLLPFCTLLFPLLRVAPPLYRWSIRWKIYRWYRVLREIDQELKETGGRLDLGEYIERLSTLETELAEVSVPLSYMEEFYNLRLHVAFVRQHLEQRQQKQARARWRAA